MPRIIFLNRYFYPDYSATSQLVSDLAFHFAAGGREVHVVTSRQRYDDPGSELTARENVSGVEIHRVASTRFGRGGLVGRSFDYASFYYSAWRALRTLVQPGDIIIAKTDPPLLSILGAKAARRGKAHLINWLQDLYPEVAIELGVPLLGGFRGRLLAGMRDRSLAAADANIVLGARMAERIAARGVPAARIQIIANWADDEQIVPVEPADNVLRKKWGLADKFVVGYSGNLGRAYEFETLLGAAEKLRDNTRIAFLFVGGGKQFDDLAAQVTARALKPSFHFLPYQDRAALKYSLGVPDVHWISLKPSLEGLLFPSKLYGILAAGRPVVAVTAKNGEIAALVERHGCGIAVEPGDAEALAAAIATLAQDAKRCADLGRRARALLEANFSRRHAFEQWDGLIEKVGR